MADVRQDHVTAFVADRTRGRETQKHERATLRRFVALLRRRGVLSPAPPPSPLDALVDDYVAYLRTDRGLAANSIAIYGPCATPSGVIPARYLAPDPVLAFLEGL